MLSTDINNLWGINNWYQIGWEIAYALAVSSPIWRLKILIYSYNE